MYPQNILKQLWGYIKRLRRRYFIGDKSIYNKFNIYNNDPLYIINHKVMQFTRNHINVITVNSMDELRKENLAQEIQEDKDDIKQTVKNGIRKIVGLKVVDKIKSMMS